MNPLIARAAVSAKASSSEEVEMRPLTMPSSQSQSSFSSMDPETAGDVAQPSVEQIDEDIEKKIKKRFRRFDWDKSGTINTEEELSQLTLAVYFALQDELEAKIDYVKFTGGTGDMDLIDDAVHAAAHDANFRDPGWSTEDYIVWFRAQFMKSG